MVGHSWGTLVALAYGLQNPAQIAIPRGYRLRPVEAVQTWLAAAEISAVGSFGERARSSCSQ